MKYIIMHGSQWHETFEGFEEADNYYWEMVDEDGDHFDLTLCRVIEHHESTKTPDIRPHSHWNVYCNIVGGDEYKLKPIGKATNNLLDIAYSPYFNRGRY